MMPEVQVCGIAAVVSFKGFTFSDNIAMSRVATIGDNMKIYYFLQSCLGTKLKGQYMFEVPMIIRTVMTFITTFMSSKIRSRYHMAGNDYSILKTHFHDNMDILPKEFGGMAPEGATPWLINEVKKMRMGARNEDSIKSNTDDNTSTSTNNTTVLLSNQEKLPQLPMIADVILNLPPETALEPVHYFWLIRLLFLLLFVYVLILHEIHGSI